MGTDRARANLATGLGAVNVSVGEDSISSPPIGGEQQVVRGHHQTRGNSNIALDRRRAKSQRRRDAWINDQANIEQKRKYRALLRGYKTFKKKCTATDEDVELAVSRHGPKVSDISGIPQHQLNSGAATDKAMDSERREMRQLLELLQDGGVGYVPKKKASGWV